jgi:hypothetical protein
MTPVDTAVLAQIAVVVVATIASLSGVGIAVHSYLRRARRATAAQFPAASDDRLERLEQAVESIAIEVERISEGQRFLTKLQTDRSEDRVLRG